jgi:hypothetical protein
MNNKTCLTCPSLLQPDEARLFFGKNIGTAVCARYGKPMGTTKSSAGQKGEIAKAIAATCPSYGEPKPTSVNWNEAKFTIAFPDSQVLRFNRKLNPDAVRSCGMCEHFVREEAVAREIGFSVGLCSAKGTLQLPSRLVFEARDCEYRSLGATGVRTDVTGIMMLPEYDASFNASGIDPVRHHMEQMRNFVDPREYPTDQVVSDEDQQAGIRAWRKVADPTGNSHTFLPIFDVNFFSEEERSKIPFTGDDEHPEDYVDHNFYTYKIAVLWRELDETPAAHGMAGTGKTELGRYLAWLMCIPFERISISGSSEVDDLAGKWTYEPDKGTIWNDGRIVSAWGKPCVMVLDEPNTGPPDVMQFVRPMFDNSKQLVLDQHKGDRRTRSDHCYPLLAMNPAWDPKNVGAHELSDADTNRLMHLYFDLPPARLEREILVKRCEHDGYQPSAQILETVMKIAGDIRGLAEEDTIPISWGIRPQIKVIRASKWFDLITCYRMAVADFLDPKAQEQILNVVRSHVE